MRALFASAEIYPYAKTGGLADVAQALPRALSEEIKIQSVMPLYRFIDQRKFNITPLWNYFHITLADNKRYHISLYHGSNQGVETLFVYERTLCDRPAPYGDENGDYPDNDLRFGIFSRAIVEIARIYEIDLLHLNDWHTALAALWARESSPSLRTIFTIHNLAFQGIFPRETLTKLGLPRESFTPDGIEYWGSVNIMKAGIVYSDAVTTVSPRYAEEILHPRFGCGLEGLLRSHRDKLYGILNGIDTILFDPAHDPALPYPFTADSLQNKKRDKEALCHELGFPDSTLPLFIFIGRFTRQKGLDLIVDALPALLKRNITLAIIGEGDPLTAALLRKGSRENERFWLFQGYNETLSHKLYAAADFLLMPSSFEPCGLNQLIALRYGTIPLVHRVGGLYDTILDIDDSRGEEICGRGVEIDPYESSGLLDAVERATALYENRSELQKWIRSNMQCDLSFRKSAEAYLRLYKNGGDMEEYERSESLPVIFK